MNLTHSSKLAPALVALLVVAAVALPVAAVSVEQEESPQEAEVGSKVSATYTLTDLYQDPDFAEWTLVGRTELKNTTWTIKFMDQTGSQVDQMQLAGKRINASGISADNDVAEVQITVTGDVPPIGEGNYTYPDTETFRVAKLDLFVNGGDNGDIGEWTAQHYSSDSREARTQLGEAQSAIQSAESQGATVDDAKSDFESAKQAYRGGNFELAVSLANQAQEKASGAQQSAQSQGQMMQYALIGGGVVLLLILAGGGFYMYRQRNQQSTKLR